MAWIPSYKLYASDGVTLVYTFDAVTRDNSPKDAKKGYEIEGFRGEGSVHVSGSEASWNLILDFYLQGDGYQALIAKMDTILSTIQTDTKYVLKIDRTPSTTQNYNVMRKQSIEWTDTKRIKFQKGTITFRVNTW